MLKDNPIWAEPEHIRHAQSFINYINNDLSGRFRSINFDVNNITSDEITSTPGLATEARLEKLYDIANEQELDGMKADIESASSATIRVFMKSNSATDINKACDILSTKAHGLNGVVIDDSQIGESGAGKLLDRILGHRPEHEDVLQYSRIIGYKFS